MKVFVSPTSFLKPENKVARDILESYAQDVTYNDLGVPLKGEEIITRLQGCDGYIAGLDYITADVIARIPDSVKVISRYGAGVDRVALDACAKRGIAVTNTPGANATAVCELAFALMLSLARNIPALNSAVLRGKWPRANGMELAGKTLGILGMGMIGKKLALRAKAFDMNVIAYDPYFDQAFADEHNIEKCEQDVLVSKANVISLHLPLCEQTKNLINEERIDKMPRGVLIINTSRGEIIDEDAAADALQSGIIGGIGLDVFRDEPPINSPLLGLEHVVATPHTGAHTREAVQKMGMMSVENLISILDGKQCSYVVC